MAGCGGEPPAQDESGRPGEPVAPDVPAAATVEFGEDVLARLAQADGLDGREDRIVEQCFTCKLSMAGKADYASTIGEYEAHFCSDHCKESFEEDPHQKILSTPIPEKSEG